MDFYDLICFRTILWRIIKIWAKIICVIRICWSHFWLLFTIWEEPIQILCANDGSWVASLSFLKLLICFCHVCSETARNFRNWKIFHIEVVLSIWNKRRSSRRTKMSKTGFFFLNNSLTNEKKTLRRTFLSDRCVCCCYVWAWRNSGEILLEILFNFTPSRTICNPKLFSELI